MHLNHPNVVNRALEFHRRELRAETADARRAAEACPTRVGRPPLAVTVWQWAGSMLADLMRRFRRDQPVGRADSSAATTGAPS